MSRICAKCSRCRRDRQRTRPRAWNRTEPFSKAGDGESSAGKVAHVGCKNLRLCARKDDALERVEALETTYRVDGDWDRPRERKAVGTAADGRKGDRGKALGAGEFKRSPVARGKQFRLAVATA